MTAISDKKLQDKMMKEKTLEMKKAIELIKQNTYKKNKKNTIPETLNTTKEKQLIKEEPIQRMSKICATPKNKIYGNPSMQILQQLELEPHRIRTATTAGKKDIMQGHADNRDLTTTEQ